MMRSQFIWFWNKSCIGWTATTHLCNQEHSSVQSVQRRSWSKRQTSGESFLSHDADLRSEESPNPVALDDGEAHVIHEQKHVPPTVSQREFDLHQISHSPNGGSVRDAA